MGQSPGWGCRLGRPVAGPARWALLGRAHADAGGARPPPARCRGRRARWRWRRRQRVPAGAEAGDGRDGRERVDPGLGTPDPARLEDEEAGDEVLWRRRRGFLRGERDLRERERERSERERARGRHDLAAEDGRRRSGEATGRGRRPPAARSRRWRAAALPRSQTGSSAGGGGSGRDETTATGTLGHGAAPWRRWSRWRPAVASMAWRAPMKRATRGTK